MLSARMKRPLAIIGFGRLGKACGEAIAASEDLAVAGLVRRPESLNRPLPERLRGVAVARANLAVLMRR